MCVSHAVNVKNDTELHSSQKRSKTASSVGVETIALSDLMIDKDLPPDALARYKIR